MIVDHNFFARIPCVIRCTFHFITPALLPTTSVGTLALSVQFNHLSLHCRFLRLIHYIPSVGGAASGLFQALWSSHYCSHPHTQVGTEEWCSHVWLSVTFSILCFLGFGHAAHFGSNHFTFIPQPHVWLQCMVALRHLGVGPFFSRQQCLSRGVFPFPTTAGTAVHFVFFPIPFQLLPSTSIDHVLGTIL